MKWVRAPGGIRYHIRMGNKSMSRMGNKLSLRIIVLLFLGLFPATALRAQHTAPTTMTVVCQPPVVEREGAVLLPLNFLQETLGISLSTHNGVQRLRYYDKTVDVQVGQTKAVINERETNLAVAPVAVDNQIYVPVPLITEALGLGVDIARRYEDRTSLNISGKSGLITGVRHSVAPDKVRVVVDLDAPALFSVHRFMRAVTVDLAAVASPQFPLPPALPVNDPLVSQIDFLSGAPGHTFASATCRYRAPTAVFTLAQPFRVIIDCPKVFEEKLEQSIAPGITYRQIRRGTPDGPLMVYLTEVDWNNPQIEVDVVPAGERIMSRQPVSAIAAAENAIVAVNGGYFAIPSGAPIGAMVRNREWMRLPSRGRSVLGITADRKIVMDNLNAVGTLTFNQMMSVVVHDLNATREENRIIVYTPRWGGSVTIGADDFALSVSGGKVVEVYSGAAGDVSIPQDGFIVVATGTAKASFAQMRDGLKDQPVELTFRTQPDFPNLLHVLGGGPRLVKGGQEFVTAEMEQFRTPPFQNDPIKGRAPRTAVGVTKEGKLLFVVIDGRQPGFSIGATLWETARLMIEFGAVDALNLDGGGSSTMVVQSKVVNAPSDGRERPVGNALVVRVKKQG